MCNRCERYLCLWNRIFNLITYYQNVIILNPSLSVEKVKAIENIIAMLEQKKELVEKILTDLKCPGFESIPFDRVESVTKGGAK